MRKLLIIILAIVAFGNSLFAQNGNITNCRLVFKTSVDSLPFSFDSIYQNHSGESFKVRRFAYYISHIRFVYEDGKTISLNQTPHLITEADSSSKQLQLSAPRGNISSIQFLLGIDSAVNVSGVQSGDLDPTKGMFWIWNTGYIMAKLEGSSPASKAPGKQYSYDIGGYKPGENVTREISLPLEKAMSQELSATSQQPTINKLFSTNHQPQTIIITANINKWFSGKNEIKISEQPMCHSPGKLAVQVADNYAEMFSIRAQ